MHLQLRNLLTALTGERSYKRSGRFLLIFSFSLLTVIVGLNAGFGVIVWQYWSTLLFSGFLAGGFFTLASLAYPLLALLRLPLDLAILQGINSSEPFALAMAVRRALASGETAIAPVLSDQAEEDGERLFSNAPVGAESLVVAVPDALVTSLAGPIVHFIFAALLLVMAGVMGSLFPLTPPGASALMIFLAILCGGFALGALLLLIAGARSTRRRALQRRGMTIQLDSLGLTFRQPVWKKPSHHIAWMEMRALARFTYKDKQTRLQTVYLLDSESQTLLWAGPPDEAYAPPPQRQTIAERRESARSLAAAITSRTRLPMRDLTDTVTALTGSSLITTTSTTPHFLKDAWDAALFTKDVETATMIWHVRQPGARRQPRALRKLIAEQATPSAASSDTPDVPSIPPRLSRWATLINTTAASVHERRQLLLRVARALIPYYPTEAAPDIPASFRRYLRRERLQRSLPKLLGASVIFLLAALLITSAAGWYQERGVERMLRALPQQTTAQTPLYFASFRDPRADQADWEVHPATKNEPYAAAFVNGAYQVSSSDPNSSAYFWTQRDEEGDIAISTTVTIHGLSAQTSYTTAGVIFDVTAGGYEYSAFGLDEQGDWQLWRYDANKNANDPWNFMDLGRSSAAHTGDGATNTLLLLRHGPLYLLYINNTLIDRYYDSDHSLPPGGDIGVYIDDGDIVARFNDFAIYPIPPQLAAVPIASGLPTWLL